MIHPDHLIRVLTPDQIDEWEAYDKIDPIGGGREDYRMAYLASVLTNIAIKRWGKDGTKPNLVGDHLECLPWLMNLENVQKQNKPQQSVEEMKELLMGIAKHQDIVVEKRQRKKIEK